MARNRHPGGRVTPKGSPPLRARPRQRAGPSRTAEEIHEPTPSSRYTPSANQDLVVRPRWHRIVGWIGVAAGLLTVALNDMMLMGDDLTLLPFGHSELYLMVGLLTAGLSTRFLGLFDRQTVYL